MDTGGQSNGSEIDRRSFGSDPFISTAERKLDPVFSHVLQGDFGVSEPPYNAAKLQFLRGAGSFKIV